MIDDANKDELIEQYLLGNISGIWLDEFNARLDTDEHFRREVALQKAIIRNIKTAGRKEWADKLQSFHNELYSEKFEEEIVQPVITMIKPRRRFYERKSVVAAAIIIGLIFISGLLFTTVNNRVDSESIFQANYIPYAYLEQGTRALPFDRLNLREQAFQAYEQRNYFKSVELFKSILLKGEDETVLFYLGNAYLSANKATDAESTFKEYLRKYEEYEAESRWYLSLSYLKQKKLKETRSVLEAISKEDNDYSKKAVLILKDLQI